MQNTQEAKNNKIKYPTPSKTDYTMQQTKSSWWKNRFASEQWKAENAIEDKKKWTLSKAANHNPPATMKKADDAKNGLKDKEGLICGCENGQGHLAKTQPQNKGPSQIHFKIVSLLL